MGRRLRPASRATRWLAAITASLALLLAAACERPPARGRVMLLGLDGLDPDVVDLLVAEGALPHFAKLRRDGAFGRLRSSRPLLSPILWTTIATGKPPDQHQIGHFVAVNPVTGEQLPVTSRGRKVKALWNIASAAGRRVAVVGWWATWPAESVDGAIVSDHTCYHFLFDEGLRGGGERSATVHPAALQDRVARLVRRPGDLTAAELAPYVHVDTGALARSFDFADPLAHFRWAFASAESYRAIAADLWRVDHPDLLLTYIEGTDSVSHLFGHLFRVRGLVGDLADQQRRYGDAVEGMYRLADRVVGEWMGMMGADTTLMVLSDHGFALGALPDDPNATRDLRRVSERAHRDDGILYLYGRGVRAGATVASPTLLDIAPTVLALLGIAPPRDMSGRVLTGALTIADPPRLLASYEGGGRAAPTADADPAVDVAVLERLRSLGYLDAESPQSDRTLAAALFQEGKYAEAATAFAALVRAHPDDGALRASWAGALGALGRYDEALGEIDRAIAAAPLAPEGFHNRAVIHERQGRREDAIADYRTALRYDPSYAPSRAALRRLGVASGPIAGDPTARQAAALAGQAADLARRGDYPQALARLDEAQRLAPRSARVFHYRANVAFLMGDRPAAIAALEQALALEPDNALFRQNLERLRAAGSPGR